jgi:hypothetical protein
MLINTSHCCDRHVNEAIEDLFTKAASDPPNIWDEHHSPFVKRLIELFTERGLMRVGSLQVELQKWLDGERHKPGERPATPPGYVERWTDVEMALAKLYLETLPPAEFTADDWMMCIDYLHARYWPADQLRAEAEWLTVRSGIMGRVQARMAEISDKQADALLAAAPATVAEAGRRFGMTAAQQSMLEYGRARCAESIVTAADGLRRRIKGVILEYQKGVALGDPSIRESMQTRLFDQFGQANVDWRRIAMTEGAENQLQGFILSLKPGTRVRRVEQYNGACPFCRKIDGMELEVIPASESEGKDPWKFVWAGKSNIGRSAAPRKRVGGELIDREDAERWWPAAGVQHPHCRGTWIELKEPDSAGDPEFTAWMRSVLEKKE